MDFSNHGKALESSSEMLAYMGPYHAIKAVLRKHPPFSIMTVAATPRVCVVWPVCPIVAFLWNAKGFLHLRNSAPALLLVNLGFGSTSFISVASTSGAPVLKKGLRFTTHAWKQRSVWTYWYSKLTVYCFFGRSLRRPARNFDRRAQSCFGVGIRLNTLVWHAESSSDSHFHEITKWSKRNENDHLLISRQQSPFAVFWDVRPITILALAISKVRDPSHGRHKHEILPDGKHWMKGKKGNG